MKISKQELYNKLQLTLVDAIQKGQIEKAKQVSYLLSVLGN